MSYIKIDNIDNNRDLTIQINKQIESFMEQKNGNLKNLEKELLESIKENKDYCNFLKDYSNIIKKELDTTLSIEKQKIESSKESLNKIKEGLDIKKRVKINLGGKIYDTLRSTLLSRPSIFRNMFSEEADINHDKVEEYFIDWSDDNFKTILYYLRTGNFRVKEDIYNIMDDIHFFELKDIQDKIFTIQLKGSKLLEKKYSFSIDTFYIKTIKGNIITVIDQSGYEKNIKLEKIDRIVNNIDEDNFKGNWNILLDISNSKILNNDKLIKVGFNFIELNGNDDDFLVEYKIDNIIKKIKLKDIIFEYI